MRIFPMMAAIALAVSANAAVAGDGHGKEMGKGMQGMESMHGMDHMKEMEGMKHDQNMGQKISGKGTVQAIDAEAKTMTMAHEPIPALQWPAMTMTFNLQSTALTQAIEVNDKVDFEFKQTDGGYTITSIEQQD